MRILTIGCGYIGSVLAKHLSEKIPSAEIVVSDEDEEAIEKVVLSIDKKNVSSALLDFYDYNKIVKTARDFDIVVGLTPGKLGYRAIQAVIDAGVNMVDLSYMSEDPLTLNKKARKAGKGSIKSPRKAGRSLQRQ